MCLSSKQDIYGLWREIHSILFWFVICCVPQAGIEYVFLITQHADGWIDRLEGSDCSKTLLL